MFRKSAIDRCCRIKSIVKDQYHALKVETFSTLLTDPSWSRINDMKLNNLTWPFTIGFLLTLLANGGFSVKGLRRWGSDEVEGIVPHSGGGRKGIQIQALLKNRKKNIFFRRILFLETARTILPCTNWLGNSAGYTGFHELKGYMYKMIWSKN